MLSRHQRTAVEIGGSANALHAAAPRLTAVGALPIFISFGERTARGNSLTVAPQLLESRTTAENRLCAPMTAVNEIVGCDIAPPQ